MRSRRRIHLVEVAVEKKDHRWLRTCNLKRAWHPVISFPLAMKRVGGIVCCLFLLLASAAWALERCQGFDAHPGGHAHSEEASHTHTQGIDLLGAPSSPHDPTIHCADSREVPRMISLPSPRMVRPLVAFQILPASYDSAMTECNGWIIHSEKRPPGWFLSAVSPYLSLSVLRF